uniref:Flavin-containing monooxygenase n=1 Tax=Megaselia scalaris TaxID=36166 RepID=T1H1R1_MEGSC
MEVCIIGAGMAGVCTAKHSLQNGFKTTVFEQTGAIGGTWVYTDTTEKDEYGLDIHSSMYKSLHTNLPKEIMGFPDFPFPELEKSYDVLQFIRDYAENFNVNDLIKFHHYVVRVRPYDGRWEVVVKDLPNNKYLTYNFDFVFICNGHYQEPLYPTIEGLDSFSGTTIHSHYYREPQPFRDETVLVIGAGPSGRDIAEEVSHVAKKVFISHHEPKEIKGAFTSNVVQKPDCFAFRDGNIVEFKDGSKEKITKILFCTGYKFTFPFLSMDSGVTIEDNYVKPLYKHCISINSPRLAFIGLCFRSLISHMLDIQVRFAFSFFTGRKTLPSRKEMLQDMEKDIKERAERVSLLEKEQYYNDLAATAEIENVKPVIMKLYFENQMNNKSNYLNFRKNKYKIVDDENFIQIFD